MTAPRLIGLATAVPPHVVRQEDAKALVGAVLGDGDAAGSGAWARLLGVFDRGDIASRRVCMPPQWYAEPHGFGARNDCYVEHAVRLATEAAGAALARAGVAAHAIADVVFVSTTGVATPSVDARLAAALGLPAHVRRTPVWGLGCAGGAAGLARARAFALADPGACVLLVAVELCSLSFQPHDRSKRNVVAASLFADGAAAAVVAGAASPFHATARGLDLVAAGATLWPGTLDVMGWRVDGDGLHVVFSKDIPALVRAHVRASVDGFLARHGTSLADVAHVVAHPGGLKVLAAYAEALERDGPALRHARDVLHELGNMSSPTCLFVLERFLAADEIRPGEQALLSALGPGFGAEYVLLRRP